MQPKYHKFYLALKTALAVPATMALLAPSAAYATAFTSSGQGTKAWETASTWTAGVNYPGTSGALPDTATINSGIGGTPITVTYNSSNAANSISSITVGTAGADNNLRVNGGTLAVTGLVQIGGNLSGANNRLQVVGGAVNAGSISIGGGGSNDILQIDGGVVTSTGTVSLSNNPGNELRVQGGTLNANAALNILQKFTLSSGTVNALGTTTVSGTAGSTNMTGGTFSANQYTQSSATATTTISSGSFTAANYTQTANTGSTTTVNGGTFTVTGTLAQKANLTINNGATNSVGTLAISGGTTTLTNGKIAVGTDYTNTGFNSGNAFNRNANNITGNAGVGNAATIVSKDMATGQGYNQGLSVNGGAVVHADNATPANGNTSLTLNAHTTASITANGGAGAGSDVANGTYTVKNTGSFTKIRGAVQTATGSGNITDGRLSGTGVTAGNYDGGTGIAAGGSSSSRTVTFTGSSIGPLAAGQAVQVVDNFGEVQVLSINGTAYDLAKGSSSDVTVANQRVGGGNTSLLSVSNTSTSGNNSLTEDLHAVITAVGNATGGGTVDVTSGGSQSVNVGVKTISAGHITGTANVALTSQAIGGSGLGNTALTGLTQNVSGNVYNAAQASTLVDHNFGNLHVNKVANFSQNLTNTATGTAADGFSSTGYTEQLKATLNSTTPAAINASVSAALIDASGSGSGNNTVGTVSVGIDTTGVAGNKNGNIVVGLSSDGTNTSGLSPLSLGTQTVNVSATTYDYANGTFQKNIGDGGFSGSGPTWTLDFGSFAQGGGSRSANMDVKNSTINGFADLLGGTFSIFSGSGFSLGTGFTANAGVFANSILGTDTFTNTFSGASLLSVTLSDATAGVFDEVIRLRWNGFNSNIDGVNNWSGTSLGQGTTQDIFLHLMGTVTSSGGGNVPEPDTLWLFGSASVAAWLNTRRKKNCKA